MFLEGRGCKLSCQFEESSKANDKDFTSCNFKQNVPNALAIFVKTIMFPVIASAAAFLTLFNQWWVLSNSKARYSTANYLEHVSLIGDDKPSLFTHHGRLDPDLARRENSQ